MFVNLQRLIHRNIFKYVEDGFLHIGQTHEDIDQAFRKTSDRSKRGM